MSVLSLRRSVGLLAAAAIACAPTTVASAQPTLAGQSSTPGLGTSLKGAAATVKIPDNVRFYQRRVSLLGTHTWYQQRYQHHVVIGGWYAVHDWDNRPATTWDHRLKVRKLAKTSPAVSPATAADNVDVRDKQAATPRTIPGLVVLPGRSGAPARLVWRVLTTSGSGVMASYVDAANGRTLRTVQLAKSARADGSRSAARGAANPLPQGKVFDPNPVVSLQDESLRDHGDANSVVPDTAYQTVDLRNLRGNDTLVGKWAKIVNAHAAPPTPDPGTGRDTYFFKRSSDYFEQVNAYYAVNAEQEYLRALGLKHVNAGSQPVKTDAFPDDNSYYDPSVDQISLGTGGVDDAEDAEVIWHEYGHAIQDDQVPGYGTSQQAGSIGEGFGDYMAAVMSQAATTPNDTPLTPAACLMDWDSTSYTSTAPHCIRRTDLNLDFRKDRNGEVHHDGQIWSRALWDMYLSPDINTTPGDDVATRIIVEAQFNFTPTISMPAAAKRIINTARALPGTDPSLVAAIKTAFRDRHIL